jgi:metallophosphoesterase (TIGR03767 family)
MSGLASAAVSAVSALSTSVSAVDRRTFLLASGASAVGTGLGLALGPASGPASAAPPASAASVLGVAQLAPTRDGTTLQSVAAPHGTGGYRRLFDGPGWNQVVRTDLAAAKNGRESRRTTMACFVQFTDTHLTDVQSPLRTEFFRSAQTSAWRPQEALTVVGITSLIERVNALRGGPVTGAPIEFVMTTGDNTDSNSQLELEWFLTAMGGGRITPNSGDAEQYEGVQNSGLKLYWQPDAALRDNDKAVYAFPRLDDFLPAAIRQVNSPGLRVPWYSTVGNHDMLGSGAYAHTSYWAELATGSRKLESIPAAEAERLIKIVRSGTDPTGSAVAEAFKAYAKKSRTVTADERRAPASPHQYLAAHLNPAHKGLGPVGHGYSAANLAADTMYYTFRISDDVLGISLDTTNRGGHYTGSIGTAQLNWLEKTLHDNADSNILVFSHHTSTSMENYNPDPTRPGEKRHGGAEVLALLTSHSNVLAWINGHSHRNEVTPHGAMWEINTASHIDYPQLARVIEIADNHDGTLSIFTTLLEASAPHRTDFDDLSQTGLAALYRELAFNQPERGTANAGEAKDRNTELLLKKR